MTSAVILFNWTEEGHMVPARGHAKRCDEKFTVGELYRMEVSEERSHRSHRHYFAAVHEAWMNLPEELAERFPSADHLRKWCLVSAGFCDHFVIDAAGSQAEARAIAETIRRISTFSVIAVRGNVVFVYKPRSQDLKTMNKKEFQASKDAVLGKLSEMLGVTVEDLKERAHAGAN